jgi:methionine-rich copper-binding protein CopC
VLLKTFAVKLQEKIKLRFNGLFTTSNLAVCAAALHPRYATLPFVPQEHREAVYTAVWKKIASDTHSLQTGLFSFLSFFSALDLSFF